MKNDKEPKKQKQFGLIGKNISYSFSKKFFTDKFRDNYFENCSFDNYDIQSIDEFPEILKNKFIKGLNVTIPYKEEVIPFLNKLSKKAKKIGAVNCIKISKKKKIAKGYNTDCYGFKKSLKPHLKEHHKKALILGTGGASKAIAYVLEELQIAYKFVSRNPDKHQLSYQELTKDILEEYTVIINCSPVGTFPNIEEKPDLNYSFFTKKHIAYDLVYNPEKTAFLKHAEQNKAVIKNGYDMLVFQAEKAWDIWNK